MSIPKRIRDRVVEREDHCCIKCGQWAEGGSLHHRKLRSQGGKNTLENLVLAHGSGTTGCHGWMHHERHDSAAQGYIVRPWQDPADVPVEVYGHGLVYLTRDGRYEPATGPSEPLDGAA